MYKENALRWKDVKAGQFGNMIRKFCGMVMGRTMPFLSYRKLRVHSLFNVRMIETGKIRVDIPCPVEKMRHFSLCVVFILRGKDYSE